MVYEKLF